MFGLSGLNNHMKIGELASQCDVSVETLRFYESEGLVIPQQRSSNGYRLYSQADKQRLGFILHAKKVGFSLQEIKQLLSLRADKDSYTCEEVKNYTGTKINEIEAKIADLQKMKQALDNLYNACCGGHESARGCTILSSLDDNTLFSNGRIHPIAESDLDNDPQPHSKEPISEFSK
jgi:MerR family transcriptional regulator, Zn(II)-responsive regulator of zntA